VLNEKNVKRQPVEIDQPFEPVCPDGSPSGIEILPFEVTGKSAWYLESEAQRATNRAGDTLGLRIRDKATGKFFYFLAACAEVTDDLKSRIRGASLVFFDGTVWRDDEMIITGLSTKTGKSMGHISMSGSTGAIAALESLGIERKIFLHINNSNPVWFSDSAERHAAAQAGWQIPADGMEIVL
jgi:pyrroloquinoline quinone biosynthesis protein B